MAHSRPFFSAILTLAAGAFTATASVVTVTIGTICAYATSVLLYVVDSFKVEPLRVGEPTPGEGYGLGSRFTAYQARREQRQRPHVRDTLRLCV